ncbi:MAG: DUF167 domain-containing protein [Candidatus Dojkabacteria bacterium]|jgi:uncharacterized protein YggU (UPF0235/DUF167 family)
MIRIEVVVKTNSFKSEISHLGKHKYLAFLRSKPHDNNANLELIELLSEYFQCPKSFIEIKKGIRSRTKLIDIGV